MLTSSQLADIRKTNLPLFNLLSELLAAVNQMGLSSGLDPKPAAQTDLSKAIPAPKQPASIVVTVGSGLGPTGGIVFVRLKAGVGNAPGANYTIEQSEDAGFKEVESYHLGNTLQMTIPLPPGTYYFRSYAQYPHSQKSPYTKWDGAVTVGS